MLDLLPDLSGQPAWVVVVVVALMAVGSIGVKWVGARIGRDDGDADEDAEGDRPAPTSGRHEQAVMVGSDAQTTLVLTKALDLLANEAVESQGARAEADRLRAELLACSAERDRVARKLTSAQAELEQCNRECRRLAMRALEREVDPGE